MGSIDYESQTLVVETDVLIVGAGPAGAALACFLGSHGVNGIIVSNAAGPTPAPRANYCNAAGFECLRDIGLEERAREISHDVSEFATYSRLCKSLDGEEIYRTYTFGNNPKRNADYADASPCKSACLPQNQLEPLLLSYASDHGFPTRFGTELLYFTQDESRNEVESELKDLMTGQRYTVRSRFLCGADGAQSKVAKDLNLPMNVGHGGALAINVWIDAPMGHLMANSPALLTFLTRPDLPQPSYGMMGLAHFIKPWNEWEISLFCHPSLQKVEATEDEIMARVRELIGDESIPMKLKRIDVWKTEETYADYFSSGNVHCLGDSVHRHPPFSGLGANTSIQDAFNLAWKMAYILQGKAGPSLMKTYNDERQPIGKSVVRRANDSGRLNFAMYGMLGAFDPDVERRNKIEAVLKEDSEEGREKRHQLRTAIRALEIDNHGLGGEFNQWYRSSAVLDSDEKEKPYWPDESLQEMTTNHFSSTYPGFRVPHAWLGQPTKQRGPRPPLVSTRDLCGHGRFTILTGVGGKAPWTAAAVRASKLTGVPIQVYSIGWGQDYEDTFFAWYDQNGVGEKGAVLVRPDRTVAWRSESLPTEPEKTLEDVLRSVLSLQRSSNSRPSLPPSQTLAMRPCRCRCSSRSRRPEDKAFDSGNP